jgi:hypothetical protein
MAFALTKYKAYGTLVSGPSRKQAIQYVELHITAANTDTDLDIADASGTFWTAAQANSTYGDIAEQALESITDVGDQSAALLSVMSPEILSRAQDNTSPASGFYGISVSGNLPNIEWASGNAPTAYQVTLMLALPDGVQPIRSDLGAAVTA